MASVFLEFVPPTRDGVVKLYIYEAPSATGILTMIEEVDEIGAFPAYISAYTTDLATSKDDWFAIQWEDDKGAKTDISMRVQGGTQTLVGKVTDRVLQRDPSLSEVVVVQEVEGAIAEFYGDSIDPYSINPADVGYKTLSGIVYLALARSYIFAEAVDSGGGWSVGMVSMRSTSTKNIQALIDLANSQLGTGTSVVLQMASINRRCGSRIWELEP